MRVHLACRRMSLREADILEYYLKNVPGVTAVKVFDRTQDAIITYQADRTALIRALAAFSFTSEQAVALVPEHTSRQLNREYEDKLVFTVCRRAFSRLFLPYPITTAIALFRSVKYIKEGLKALWHGKLSVAVLDATAVTVSMLRGDFNTAGSVMFMLRLGEILEEWTHKKSARRQGRLRRSHGQPGLHHRRVPARCQARRQLRLRRDRHRGGRMRRLGGKGARRRPV